MTDLILPRKEEHMEIKLHFTPEMPTRSADVLAFHYSVVTGHIYNIMSCTYSIVYELFNCHDDITAEKFEELKEGMQKYTDSVLCWAYMDEITEEVFDEIQR